jgi:hypothetical protein
MGLAIAFFIPVFILGVMVAAAGTGLALGIFLGTLAVVVGLAVALGIGGPLSIAVRYYSLMFYGSRYSRLGGLLWPAPVPPQP